MTTRGNRGLFSSLGRLCVVSKLFAHLASGIIARYVERHGRMSGSATAGYEFRPPTTVKMMTIAPALRRRELTFTSLDEVVADAQALVAARETKMLGNWPLEKLLAHLAIAINGSIDGISARAPWFVRLLGRLGKHRILSKPMRAGVKLPRQVEPDFYPDVASRQAALGELQAAVARTKSERMAAAHPILGKLTHDEWTQLHLRHAELHLSFALPLR